MKKTPEERYQAVADAMAVIRNNPDAYRAYIKDELDRMTYNTEIHYAKEEGRKRAGLETARRMKAKNYDFAEISEITGLSLDEISSL